MYHRKNPRRVDAILHYEESIRVVRFVTPLVGSRPDFLRASTSLKNRNPCRISHFCNRVKLDILIVLSVYWRLISIMLCGHIQLPRSLLEAIQFSPLAINFPPPIALLTFPNRLEHDCLAYFLNIKILTCYRVYLV